MDNRSFGKHVKKARKDRGFTAEQLAEMLSISVESLWQIEGGKSGTTLDKLIMLCNVLDLSPEFFLSKDLHPNLKNAESIYNRLYEKELKLTPKELAFLEDMIDMLLLNRKKYRDTKIVDL